MDEQYNNDELSQQGYESVKRGAGKAARPVKQAGKKVAKKSAEAVKRGAKKAGRKAARAAVKIGKKAIVAAGKALTKLGQAIAKLIAAFWPYILIALGVILIVAACFSWFMDERGSGGRLDMDPAEENPLVETETGAEKAAALTESQALIDAYYKYMSCDSHEKVYVDDAGVAHYFKFSDTGQTSDFSSLVDGASKENYFYLSSYFIKMADELLHKQEFYYPEQIIKPVFHQVLSVEGDPSKKYVTALPLVDDGSKNAQAMVDGDDSTQPYAVGEDDVVESDDGDVPQREIRDNASKQLLAQSAPFIEKEVQLFDEDNHPLYVDSQGKYYQQKDAPAGATLAKATKPSLEQDTANKQPGVWDYGFGSVLQYEPHEKEKYITHTKISFTIHLHSQDWGIIEYDENNRPVYGWGDAYCDGSPTIQVSPGSDTLSSVQAKIDAYNKTVAEEKRTQVVVSPSTSQLQTMVTTPEHVTMRVQPEDQKLAARMFHDDTLHAAFGNAERITNTDSSFTGTPAAMYPLKEAMISSAATFSGNLRYEYSEEITSDQLTDTTVSGLSDDDFTIQWQNDSTNIIYGSATGSCSDSFVPEVVRAGTVYDRHASRTPHEISVPTGFQYVEDYSSWYHVYVPNLVKQDNDFVERVAAPQPGSYDEALDADGDGTLTVMDFLIKLGLLRPYAGGYISGSEDGGFSKGTITAEEQAILAQMGCSLDEQGEIRLLAKLIASEAGPNKLDQLMVASVAVNRVHHEAFPDTLIGVIMAPGQYSSWPDMVMEREPTEEMLSSARQVLYGEFSTPSSLVFQSGVSQGGHPDYMLVDNPGGLVDHHYCHISSGPTTTDIYGRPAPTAEQARARAEELRQEDLSLGISGSTGGGGGGSSGITTPGGLTSTIHADGPLYAVTGFDVLTALGNMQRIATEEELGFLDTLWAKAGAAFQNVLEQIGEFFNAMHAAFGGANRGNYMIPFGSNLALSDMRDTVIQAVTFADQEYYSDTAERFDPLALQFIFIGKDGWTGMGGGTNGMGGTLVPGVGSEFPNFTSPTTSHYNPSKSWNEVDGYAIIAMPAGTVIQSVGAGSITQVSDSSPFEVKQICRTDDGKTLVIIYGNLKETSVTAGQEVRRGDQIGIIAEGGLKLTLLIDGVNVNPMDYFYRPTFSAGASFANVLNANGLVDETLKNQLEQEINAANSNISNTYDKWHDPANKPIYHVKSVGECTWWAYGRGWQYCEQVGTLPPGGLSASYGNGGDYYRNGQKDFQVGKTARAGAWIVWSRVVPDSGGNYYGHVAFVEAVAADGTVVYSESGRSIWDKHNGRGILVRTAKNIGTPSNPNYAYGSSGAYRFEGFVYLDQPK